MAVTKSQTTTETSLRECFLRHTLYFVAHRPTPTSKKAERVLFLDLSEAAQCLLSLNTRCTPITIMVKGCDQRIKMPVMIRQRIARDENSDVDRRKKSRPRTCRSGSMAAPGARSTGGVRSYSRRIGAGRRLTSAERRLDERRLRRRLGAERTKSGAALSEVGKSDQNGHIIKSSSSARRPRTKTTTARFRLNRPTVSNRIRRYNRRQIFRVLSNHKSSYDATTDNDATTGTLNLPIRRVLLLTNRRNAHRVH